jgi:excinuclease UvrABC helicase subunit UvrB
MQFDQWRPYVLMMHARAVATPLAEAGQIAEALAPIESAIEEILEFLDHYDQSDRADESAELADLRRWREELLSRQTHDTEGGEPSNLEDLRRRLREAVAAEEFEEAARLRDQIRRMTTT